MKKRQADMDMTLLHQAAGFPGGGLAKHQSIRQIKASWDRCIRTHGLQADAIPLPNILTASEIQHHYAALETMAVLAAPEINRLFRTLNSHGYLVTLSDVDGVTVMIRAPDATDESSAHGVRLGAVWAEDMQGTNGVGTALREHQSVSVVRAHHFRRALSGLSCFAAPIFGPHGTLAAVLNVTTSRQVAEGAHDLAGAIVLRSARTIENAHFSKLYSRHRIARLSYYPDFGDPGFEMRLALDERGSVIDGTRTAMQLLSKPAAVAPLAALTGDFLGALGPDGSACLEVEGVSLYYRLAAEEPTGCGSPRPADRSRTRTPANLITPLPENARLQRLLDRRLPIMLQGETGSGKTMFARSLHNASLHCDKPFVTINCAAIPPELIESELFGYRSGAFTGAARTGFGGRISEADGGTLFLDEIGDMPIALQTKFLQVLSDGEFTPVGATRPTRVKLAVISATLHDIADLVRQGRFRQDLFFRLNGASVTLPPLRDRNDRETIINAMFRDEARDAGIESVLIDSETRAVLRAYPWPGNLRELRHAARFAAAVAMGPTIYLEDLPDYLRDARPHTDSGSDGRARIERALEACEWNVTEASLRLGISRATLHRKIAGLGLQRP